MKIIEPVFGYELAGYKFLGRGCDSNGWSRNSNLYYRCANCGAIMNASKNTNFHCICKAMKLDADAGRFGSSYGDQNILNYKKIN